MAKQQRGRVVRPPRGSRCYRRWWVGLLAVVLVVAGIAGIAIAIQGMGGGVPTAVVPEHTTHHFGQVVMHQGQLTAKFPLAVQEPTVVTDVNSS